jgi:hypothetical protein
MTTLRDIVRLQVNTNGAWRTVLNDVGEHVQDAKAAAASLTRIDAANSRRPISWRLVGADGAVLERCSNAQGWEDVSLARFAAQPDATERAAS